MDYTVYMLCNIKMVHNTKITTGIYHKIFRNYDDAALEIKSVKALRDYHIVRYPIAGDRDAKKVYIFTAKRLTGHLFPELADSLHLDYHFHSVANMTRLRMQTNAENNGLTIYKHTPDFNRLCAKSSTSVWAYRLRTFDVV